MGVEIPLGNRSKDLIAYYVLSGPMLYVEIRNLNQPTSNGADIHDIERRNAFDAIHVFQIHADTVTRTTAINPIYRRTGYTIRLCASSGVTKLHLI